MPGTNKKLTTAVENDTAYWRNIPAAVWTDKLGGHQVLTIGSHTQNKKS